DAALLRDVADRPQIEHAAGWIDWRLDENGARLFAQSFAPDARLERIDERNVDAERRELLGEQRRGSAVDRRAGEQMVAGAEQSEERAGRGAHPAGEQHSRLGPLEGR